MRYKVNSHNQWLCVHGTLSGDMASHPSSSLPYVISEVMRHKLLSLVSSPHVWCCMSIQVLAYGPGGLPVRYESVDSQHMANLMAEWRQFGVTLVPTSDSSDGEGGRYAVRSEREDSRSADHGKRRLLVLMLFLDLPENHSAMSKLCE